MVLNALGNTGLMVSPLGLGTVKFGRNQGVKYPYAFELPSDRQIIELLELCQTLGINLLDTAPAYGTSEERLGRLLRGRREAWIIATKVGEEFYDGASQFDFSPAAIQTSVERSLQRLGTDWLDIVLIHSDGDDIRILREEGALPTLLELKTAGLIRAVGMSSKTLAGGLLALEFCDLVMITHNLLYQDELPVIQSANATNKGVLIKKGLLSGHFQQLNEADPLEASLRLILGTPGVNSVIAGTLDPTHLQANAAAVERILNTVHYN